MNVNNDKDMMETDRCIRKVTATTTAEKTKKKTAMK
jgi:hypothetical protein